MIVTMPGRVCRHFEAIPTRDCGRHHAIMWCACCRAEWCEVLPGLTDATHVVRVRGCVHRLRLHTGMNTRCRTCPAEWCARPGGAMRVDTTPKALFLK